MQFPLNLLALSLLVTTIFAAEKKCQQCATPNIRENWAATGLPMRPENLVYTDKCVSPGASEQEDETLLSKNCASSCFELLIPIDDNYAILRGCHENFAWSEMTVIANSTRTCEQNELHDYQKVLIFTQENEEVAAFDALAFCPPNETEVCNIGINLAAISKTGVKNCVDGVQKTCKSCSYYDGTGDCSGSTTGTCKGAYCTKTIGTMNGHRYEARGCSGFNPFAREVCSWSEQSLNVTTSVRALAIPQRSKRSVSFSFKANQCFCQGELCNSSPRSLLSASIAILLTFTTLRFF